MLTLKKNNFDSTTKKTTLFLEQPNRLNYSINESINQEMNSTATCFKISSKFDSEELF
jgi:hypothetical protein